MKRKNVIIISIAGITLVLLCLLGFTYGYFMTNINGNTNNKSIDVTTSIKGLEITDLTLEDISATIEPGYENIKLFTVKNTGNTKTSYNIYLTDVVNTFERTEDVEFTLYRKDGNATIDTSDLSDCTIISSGSLPTTNSYIATNEIINNNGDYYTYALEVTYKNLPDINQNVDQGKTFSYKVIIDSEIINPFTEDTLAYTVIENAKKGGENRTKYGYEKTTFTSVSGENERVLNTAPDDYGTSYYYRGNVLDNYVTFAGLTWRIVRINGDGSIKIILDSVLDKVLFNTNSNDNAYVGYMYGLTGQTENNVNQCIKLNNNDTVAEVDSTYTTKTECENAGYEWAATPYDATHVNVVSSTIKIYLDNWYKTNIIDTNNETYIADEIFCADKELSSNGIGGVNNQLGYGTNSTYYNIVGRIWYSSGTNLTTLYKPTYQCTNDNANSYSRYSVNEETLSNGNKTNGNLTYPVGLLTVDETVFAGAGKYGENNKSYYLFNADISDNWWLLSPYSFNNSESYNWYINRYNGYYATATSNNTYGAARPVINLKASVKLDTSTDGTKNNPYKIIS